MSIGGTLCVSTDHSAIQQLPGGPLLAGEGPEVPARSWGHRGQGRRRGGRVLVSGAALFIPACGEGLQYLSNWRMTFPCC